MHNKHTVCAFDATLSGWRDSDGLCCELLVKISCVCLRGHLGLKWWDQLLERRHKHITTLELLVRQVTVACLLTIYIVLRR